jgi:phage shock protein A
LEELRLHNQQLVRCVEALEGSRQEYEADAERYRDLADQSEKASDTLRLKLEDLEKDFADIEKQQHDALEDARDAKVVPILRRQS